MINKLGAIALTGLTFISFIPSALALTPEDYRLYTMGAKNELLRRKNTGGLLPDKHFHTAGEAFCRELEKGNSLYHTIDYYHSSIDRTDSIRPEMNRQMKEFYTVTGIYAAIALCPGV